MVAMDFRRALHEQPLSRMGRKLSSTISSHCPSRGLRTCFPGSASASAGKLSGKIRGPGRPPDTLPPQGAGRIRAVNLRRSPSVTLPRPGVQGYFKSVGGIGNSGMNFPSPFGTDGHDPSARYRGSVCQRQLHRTGWSCRSSGGVAGQAGPGLRWDTGFALPGHGRRGQCQRDSTRIGRMVGLPELCRNVHFGPFFAACHCGARTAAINPSAMKTDN